MPEDGREDPVDPDAEAAADRQLGYARVLVEIGELDEAEAEVSRLLDAHPGSLAPLSLLARIKHMRGELSEAFACWAQVCSGQPESGSAQMRLATLLHLAEDPEKGTGEFLAVGRRHLWRKPAGMLELEKVFQRFVERRPEQAKEAARSLIGKYRGGDRDLFKLASLAEAWIAELAGDPRSAADLLERLGTERGFEEDVDRALALVRVYEALGTPEDLRKAVHVCEFLARTVGGAERVTALGRLTRLHRALGEEEVAAGYERRFLEAFQRRMHRVSLAEATEIAAERRVPLPRLAAIHFVGGVPPESPGRRQRALVLALEGRLGEAAELLGGDDDLLDLAYRADLARMSGDRRAATDLALELLRREPDERWAPGWLLEEAESDPAVVAWLADPVTESVVRGRIEAAVARSPGRSELWRQLAALHRLAGRVEEAARCEKRSTAAGTVEILRPGAVSRTLAAAVYRFADRTHGLIHEVWAERRPAAAGRGGQLEEVLGAVSPELEKMVRNVFVSVREYAQAKLPHLVADVFDHSYAFKITKEDEPSHGASAGLPTALAFLGVFLGRPLPKGVASSGVLVTDAHDVLVVRAVGDVEAKVRGAYSCALRTLILPADNRSGLESSPHVPAVISRGLVRFASTLDDALSVVFGREIWVE